MRQMGDVGQTIMKNQTFSFWLKVCTPSLELQLSLNLSIALAIYVTTKEGKRLTHLHGIMNFPGIMQGYKNLTSSIRWKEKQNDENKGHLPRKAKKTSLDQN